MDLNQVLSAIETALGVIQKVAGTPGVNVLPYASTVSSVVTAIRAAVDAGRNIEPYVEAFVETFTGDVPTQEQMDALDTRIKELDAQVDAPLPPKEEGESE